MNKSITQLSNIDTSRFYLFNKCRVNDEHTGGEENIGHFSYKLQMNITVSEIREINSNVLRATNKQMPILKCLIHPYYGI